MWHFLSPLERFLYLIFVLFCAFGSVQFFFGETMGRRGSVRRAWYEQGGREKKTCSSYLKRENASLKLLLFVWELAILAAEKK